MNLTSCLRLRHVVGALVSLLALAVIASSPQLLGDQVREGVEGLSGANPAWLWVAAAFFVASMVGAGCVWRSAVISCGGRTGVADAAMRTSVGSLAATFGPGHVGAAVRVLLFSRTLPGEGRLWTAGGIATVVGVMRTGAVGLLLALAAASGVMPWWPLAAILGALLVTAAVAVLARKWKPGRRIGHVLDAFRALGSSPVIALRLFGWIVVVMAARVAAVASVCAAFGIERPLVAALLIVPAVDLAGTLPLTPGNIGVASAAVAFALKAHGVDGDLALTAGIAFHALESAVSVAAGATAAVSLTHVPTGFRRWATPVAAACACCAIGGAFGATVLAPLV